MSYEDQKNTVGETEMLSSDEQNVSRLLSNLKRVDAPKDFDFHLKARLANASSGDYRPVWLFPIMKYALPLALFLVLGSAFVLINSSSGADVPIIADITSESVPPFKSANLDSGRESEATNSTARQPDETLTAKKNRPVEEPSALDNRQEQNVTPPKRLIIPGNSVDFRSIDRTIKKAPEGRRFGNTNTTLNPEGVGPIIPLQFRQMLMSLGIDASDAGDKTWMVMRLAKDGIAERSGLQVGDMMEAIDDKPITPLYDGSFSVKSISVRRDDKVIKIDIQPNKP
jgi:hypothetical protein